MIASAPNRYFIQIARSEIKKLSRVKITVKSNSDKECCISQIWAYTNFSELAESQGIYTKLGINLYSSTDTSAAKEKLNTYSTNYGMYEMGTMFGLNYMNLNSEGASNKLKSYLTASSELGTSVQIMPSMYWSNSPYSPDGAGGSFSDLKYSQVLYNSVLKNYVPSTPNVFSSTQWATTGSSVLNNAAISKIKSVFSDFATLLNFARARNKNIKDIDIVV